MRCTLLKLLIIYRHKHITSTPITIQDLHAYKLGESFHGDVIVTYKTVLDKSQKKNYLLRVDLTDEKGYMTVTLNVGNNFIKEHEEKLLPGKSVCITNFSVAAKTNYDRGDCEFILLVHGKSIVSNIDPVCKEYCFIPNTTIKELLASTDHYAIGMIVAIVTRAQQSCMQFYLEIKDGNTDNDKAIVSTCFI